MIELLLEHEASLEYKNRHDQSVFAVANNRLRKDVIEDRGADVNGVFDLNY